MEPLEIKTPSDLKYWHNQKHPDSHFFDRGTMRFFGDTMHNYELRQPSTIETQSGEKIRAFELYRRHPVKHGLQSSAWFDAETLDQVFTKQGD